MAPSEQSFYFYSKSENKIKSNRTEVKLQGATGKTGSLWGESTAS